MALNKKSFSDLLIIFFRFFFSLLINTDILHKYIWCSSPNRKALGFLKILCLITLNYASTCRCNHPLLTQINAPVGSQEVVEHPLIVLLLTRIVYISMINVKVVPEGYHRYFFGLKVKTYRREKAAIYAFPNHTDDGVHSDHGYLDTCDNPLGPP